MGSNGRAFILFAPAHRDTRSSLEGMHRGDRRQTRTGEQRLSERSVELKQDAAHTGLQKGMCQGPVLPMLRGTCAVYCAWTALLTPHNGGGRLLGCCHLVNRRIG